MNSKLLFIKLQKNSKIPVSGIPTTDINNAKPLHKINTLKYNVGLHSGHNNLIILDIDNKNDGLEEWAEYVKHNEEPMTVKQNTQGGGFHYCFSCVEKLYTSDEYLLIKRLKNKAGYRQGKGVDIRLGDSGYIVCEPSTIDNRPYKFTRHYNDFNFEKMPASLLNWLLEYEDDSAILKLNLMMTGDELKNILYNKLSTPQYVDSGKNWFKITTCIKNLLHRRNDYTEKDLIKIWSKWSKQSEKYNKKNNLMLWDEATKPINFNYFIDELNRDVTIKADILQKFKGIKDYDPLLNNYDDIKQLEYNKRYMCDVSYDGDQLKYEHIADNKTIIIKGPTGAGKTTSIAEYTAKYINESDDTSLIFMSIISRVMLAEQHIESFKNAGMTLKHYKNDKDNLDTDDDHTTICLNSLLLYSKYEPKYFNKFIVYIDEVNTFTKHLTHNETLNGVLKKVYVVLNKIINNCHKLIVSENVISDNVFNLISKRPREDMIFIKNEFTRYNGIKAVRQNNENDFFDNIDKHINNDDYFLCGSDTCLKITEYYNALISKYEDKKDKFILITADTQFKLENANEQFKNKFVFYSPSITAGLDFTIDIKQDVFIHMELNSIAPSDSFQQATRTRNIKTLYYYVDDSKNNKVIKYNGLSECVSYYHMVAKTENNLKNVCCFTNEDDELIFNENSFFKMFVYNEYLNDIYNTNRIQHFNEILTANGFIISNTGDIKKMDKTTAKNNKETSTEIKIITVEEYLNNSDILDELFDFRREFLGITKTQTSDNELLKKLVSDKNAFNEYKQFIKLFYDDATLKNKLKIESNNNVGYKNVFSTSYKINLIRQLEKEANIDIMEINFSNTKDDILKISDELINKLKISFRTTTEPTTYGELLPYYIARFENITGNIKLFGNKRTTTNGKREKTYNLNIDTVQQYINVYLLKYECGCNLNKALLTKLDIKFKLDDDDDNFLIENADNTPTTSEIYNNEPNIISPLDQ